MSQRAAKVKALCEKPVFQKSFCTGSNLPTDRRRTDQIFSNQTLIQSAKLGESQHKPCSWLCDVLLLCVDPDGLQLALPDSLTFGSMWLHHVTQREFSVSPVVMNHVGPNRRGLEEQLSRLTADHSC